MKIPASLRFALIAPFLAACQPDRQPTQPGLEQEENSAQGSDRYHLPESVVPQSDNLTNFGIDLSVLSENDAKIVESAWSDFERILAGKEPDCSVAYGLSDGVSLMYDCGSYEIMRVKGLSGKDGAYGYDYGPSINFLNGHKVERLKFYTDKELVELESAP